MVKFEVSVHIDRPLAEVFKYMVDYSKLPEWNSIVEEATPSETPIRVGSRVQSKARFLGRRIEGTFEVTEHELNKRHATKAEKPFPLIVTNTFEAEGGGTKVMGIFEGEPGGFFKIGEPILGRIAKKQFQAQLDTAKELLEAQVPAHT
ncbi:hypothetical protein EPN29_02640 [bacterium]|nr:MAG: hypothetical protein EPN29_02640 [bacterium]